MNKKDVVAVTSDGKILPEDWTGEISDLLSVSVFSHGEGLMLMRAAADLLDNGNESVHRDLLVALMNYGCIPSVTIDGVSALPSHPIGFVTDDTLLRCWRCFVTDNYDDAPPPSKVADALNAAQLSDLEVAAARVVYRAYRSGGGVALSTLAQFYIALPSCLERLNGSLARASLMQHVLSANREVARVALAKYMQSEAANG